MLDSDPSKAIELGHEPIGVGARPIAKGFIVLFAVVAAALLLVAGLMMLFSKLAGGDATVDALPQSAAGPPGVPTLDSDQSGSLRVLRARERKVLTEYGWIEAEAGFARIPIKRAMEMLGRSTIIPTETPSNDATQP
jgi:hypothetical protein